MTLAHGRYLAAAPALANGNEMVLRLDATGALVVTGGGGGGATIVTGTVDQQGANTALTATALDDAVPGAVVPYFWTGSAYQQGHSGIIGAPIATPARGVQIVASSMYGFDGATNRPVPIELLNDEPVMTAEYGIWTNAVLHASAAGSALVCTMQSGTRNLNVREAAMSPSATGEDLYSDAANPPQAADTVQASGGNVGGIIVTNGALAQYFQMHDKASDPVNPNVPVLSIFLDAGETRVIDRGFFSGAGFLFSLGIAWGWSSTGNTYTASGTPGLSVAVIYG